MAIEIKPIREFNALYAAVELQKVYWGTDVESVVPGQTLHTIVHSGGHVIVALDGERMIGVLIGLLATEGTPARDHLKIYSKRMLVLPEYRGQGIAQRLKFKQREVAREQGIDLITWTFDPLLSLNAHFNLRKLGCRSWRFIENYYGTSSDAQGLSIQGNSDRLVASWMLDTQPVKDRVTETYEPATLEHYLDQEGIILNPSEDREGVPYPAQSANKAEGKHPIIEIPVDFRGLVNAMPDLAKTWRTHIRDLMPEVMARKNSTFHSAGYVVTDFIHGQHEGRDRAFYVCSIGRHTKRGEEE